MAPHNRRDPDGDRATGDRPDFLLEMADSEFSNGQGVVAVSLEEFPSEGPSQLPEARRTVALTELTPEPSVRGSRVTVQLDRRILYAAGAATVVMAAAIILATTRQPAPENISAPSVDIDEPLTRPLDAANDVLNELAHSPSNPSVGVQRVESASVVRPSRPSSGPRAVAVRKPVASNLPPAELEPQEVERLPVPDPAVVYSAGNVDVVPPVALNRGILSSPPSAGELSRYTEIAIVVDETGRVKSATVLSKPATLEQAMFSTFNLSAAKNFRFSPALKGGQPVKYQGTVWLQNR